VAISVRLAGPVDGLPIIGPFDRLVFVFEIALFRVLGVLEVVLPVSLIAGIAEVAGGGAE